MPLWCPSWCSRRCITYLTSILTLVLILSLIVVPKLLLETVLNPNPPNPPNLPNPNPEPVVVPKMVLQMAHPEA